MGMKPRKSPTKLKLDAENAEKAVDALIAEEKSSAPIRPSNISAPLIPEPKRKHPLAKMLEKRVKSLDIKRRFRLLDKPSALPIRGFGDQEGEYTWEDWHEETKRDKPIRYFLAETLPRLWRWHVSSPLKRFWWGIKYRTTHKYHKLDISNKENHYLRGYMDPRERLLFGCFAVLKDFVENDMGHNDWQWNEDHQKAAAEIMALYNWWLTDRPAAWDDPESYKKDEELYLKDQEMLHRLIAVREYLWT